LFFRIQDVLIDALYIYRDKKKKKTHDYIPLTNDSIAVGNSQVKNDNFPLLLKYLKAFDLHKYCSEFGCFEDNSSIGDA